MDTIYERIRMRREELGLSQDYVAQELGYKSRSSIAKIESGDNDIPQSKIAAFAKVLKTTPGYLMGTTLSTESLEILEEDFPEGIAFIRRANKELTPAGKKRMIELMKLFMEEVDAKENEQRGNE